MSVSDPAIEKKVGCKPFCCDYIHIYIGERSQSPSTCRCVARESGSKTRHVLAICMQA